MIPARSLSNLSIAGVGGRRSPSTTSVRVFQVERQARLLGDLSGFFEPNEVALLQFLRATRIQAVVILDFAWSELDRNAVGAGVDRQGLAGFCQRLRPDQVGAIEIARGGNARMREAMAQKRDEAQRLFEDARLGRLITRRQVVRRSERRTTRHSRAVYPAEKNQVASQILDALPRQAQDIPRTDVQSGPARQKHVMD